MTLLALALAACGSGGDSSAPGGVSEGEAKSVEEAAEMLDAQRLPENALPPTELPTVEQAPGGTVDQPDPAEVTGDSPE